MCEIKSSMFARRLASASSSFCRAFWCSEAAYIRFYFSSSSVSGTVPPRFGRQRWARRRPMIRRLAISRASEQATLAVRRPLRGPTQRAARRSARQPEDTSSPRGENTAITASADAMSQELQCGKSWRCEHGGHRRNVHNLVQHCQLVSRRNVLTST